MRRTWSRLRAAQRLQTVRELLTEFRELRPDHDRAVALPRVTRIVVLVIILGRPVVVVERHDLRDDRLPEHLLALQFADHVERRVALRVRMGEHDRTVLRADVVALPVQLGRIVRREEDLEDLAIADACRIECHVDDFRVARIALADVAIAGIARMAARVARLDGRHAVDVEKHRLRAPKATTPKCCYFETFRRLLALVKLLIFHRQIPFECFGSWKFSAESW